MGINLGNKLEFFLYLKQDKKLAASLPETVELTNDSFGEMLNRHFSVIVKPVVSKGGGKEVYKVTKTKGGTIEVHFRDEKKSFSNGEKAYHFIQGEASRHTKPYIIQQKINLIEQGNKPIDFRVLVQRKVDSPEWMVTGKYGKAAKEGFFITNLKHNLAGLLSMEEAVPYLQLSKPEAEKLYRKMEQLCIRAVKRLEHVFPGRTKWGLDIGIDQSHNIYIIEMNSNPGIKVFGYLKDSQILKKIRSILRYNSNKRKESGE